MPLAGGVLQVLASRRKTPLEEGILPVTTKVAAMFELLPSMAVAALKVTNVTRVLEVAVLAQAVAYVTCLDAVKGQVPGILMT